MRWLACACVVSVVTASGVGCQNERSGMVDTEAALFGPAAMRIHPIFTQVEDWTEDERADGVEALIELQDQFGDPTKAAGRVLFELFEYRPYDPEPRGQRLAYWNAPLATLADQRERWNRTSRTYGFDLAYDPIRTDRTYVLTATFELSGGGRFFDRMIIEPRERNGATHAAADVQPATQPAATRP